MKNLAPNVRDSDWMLGLGRAPGGGRGNPLQYSIPQTEEPGGLQSIGSQRVGNDWRSLAGMHARDSHHNNPRFIIVKKKKNVCLFSHSFKSVGKIQLKNGKRKCFNKEIASIYGRSKFGKLSSGRSTGKVSFHSNPKERQCQRILKL